MSAKERPRWGAIALGWWAVLQPGEKRKGDAAALARLRRASTPGEAMLQSAAIELAGALAWRGDWAPVAELAALLAHVRSNDSKRRVAQALGARGASKDPRLMSELRFRRLLLAAPGEERMATFRRAIRMVDGRTNVADLAESLLTWDHPVQGEQRRVRWMFDYVGETPPVLDTASKTDVVEEDAR